MEHEMRTAICYYSGSGNTKLACKYLARRLDAECDLFDITRDDASDLSAYDVVGFAASSDFGGMPKAFESFLAAIAPQPDKPAFVLATYGFACGRVLSDMAERVSARGFRVVGGLKLHMPESYPPMRVAGLTFDRHPGARELRNFDAFAEELQGALGALAGGERPAARQVRLGLIDGLRPASPRTSARDDMGEKFVDAELCTECGTCAKQCVYGAIVLDPIPVFDMSACFGCWRCYNQCPQHAIYTKRFRGGPYYSRPSGHARGVLGG
jgi:flavodoxin/ferredoxin